MTNTLYFCPSFQLYGRHDLRWVETTDQYEIWECNECEHIQRDKRKAIA